MDAEEVSVVCRGDWLVEVQDDETKRTAQIRDWRRGIWVALVFRAMKYDQIYDHPRKCVFEFCQGEYVSVEYGGRCWWVRFVMGPSRSGTICVEKSCVHWGPG